VKLGILPILKSGRGLSSKEDPYWPGNAVIARFVGVLIVSVLILNY
jgi:hypothetical protein